jgi:hypothetical protein
MAATDSATAGGTVPILVGTPSDQVPDILAEGRGGITTLFVSMARRHPQGADADYLRWHTLDHRPEQHRLASVRASLRVVSTPACRAARAACDPAFDAIDHVMTYFFADIGGLPGFGTLSKALNRAGRVPFVLTPVQRGVYSVDAKLAAPWMTAGSDVLPWWPVRGLYLLVEQGQASAESLAEVAGVAGLWSGGAVPSEFSNAEAGQRLTYCFLDGDPVETAQRLQPVLERRWKDGDIRPLFAAPFHTIVPYDWNRYLP